MRDVARRGARLRWLAACAICVLLPAATAAATPFPSHTAVITYPQPRTLPTGGAGPLIVGPDGNVWFTQIYEESYGAGSEPHFLPRIVRMDALGQVSVVAEHVRSEGFALTGDGSVWFTGGFYGINRIGPDGSLESYPFPDSSSFTSAGGPIVTGADGNVWFPTYRSPRLGEEGPTVAAIARATPGGEIVEFDLPGAGGYPTRVALGPDGNVWFTEFRENSVGRISPSGEIASFPLPPGSRPGNIVAGADGALWFAEATSDGAMLGRLSTTGEFQQFPVGADKEQAIGALASGPDGRLWFSLEAGAIHRMSPSGRLSRVQLPDATHANRIVPGRDGDLWYSANAGPPCSTGDSGCGDGGYFEAGIIGHLEPAPAAVTVDGARAIRRGRWVKVRISCLDGTADSVCGGKLQLRAGRAVLGKRRFKLGTDLYRGFAVKLGRNARKRLARTGRLRIALSATVDAGGWAGRNVVVRLPRVHRTSRSHRRNGARRPGSAVR